VTHVERLIRSGRMAEPGLAALAAREATRTGLYSFERAAMQLAPPYVRRFRAETAAWAYFQAQPPSDCRLDTLIACPAKQQRTP